MRTIEDLLELPTATRLNAEEVAMLKAELADAEYQAISPLAMPSDIWKAALDGRRPQHEVNHLLKMVRFNEKLAEATPPEPATATAEPATADVASKPSKAQAKPKRKNWTKALDDDVKLDLLIKFFAQNPNADDAAVAKHFKVTVRCVQDWHRKGFLKQALKTVSVNRPRGVYADGDYDAVDEGSPNQSKMSGIAKRQRNTGWQRDDNDD